MRPLLAGLESLAAAKFGLNRLVASQTRAVLSQGGPRDAAVNFDKKNLQRHRAVSVPQHGFPV